MSRGIKRSTMAAKVAWMRDHSDLWRDLDPDEALYMTHRERWRRIANGLKDAGLISRKTETVDVPVRELIKAALSDPPKVEP